LITEQIKPKNAKRSFVKNTGIVFVSQVCGIAAAIVVGVTTARFLGPSGKGRVLLAMSAGMIVGQILSMGFDRASLYFHASGQLPVSQILGSWFIVLFGGTILTFAVIYPVLCTYFVDTLFNGIPKSLLIAGAFFCPLHITRLLVHSIFGGAEDFFKQTYHNLAVYISTLLAAICGLMLLGYGALGYSIVNIFLGFLALGYSFYLLRKDNLLRPVFRFSAWLTMMRYGCKTSTTQLLNMIDMNLGTYVINFFVNPAAVGVYSIAMSLVNVFCMLPNSIGMVLFPKAAALGAQDSRHLTALLCRNTMWLTIIIGSMFILISRWVIVIIYGVRFAEASTAFMLLMPGAVGLVVSRICFTSCAATGYPGRTTIAAVITASLTIILDLLLIPRYGMNGAAAATSVAYCTSGVMGLYWHIRLSGNHLSALLVPHWQDWKLYVSLLERAILKMNLSQIKGG
jgi:O-antigen/teichoic acid export membrane protein